MISQLLRQSVSIVPWRFRTVIKDIPIVSNLQRWLVKQFLDQQKFVYRINAGPASGLNYPVCLPDDKLIWTGTYEIGFSETLAKSVKEGDVCYDIGGFRGFFSGVLALAGAKSVYIFEPFPRNCQQIQAVIDANPQLSSLRLFSVAIGERKGEAEFLVMPEASMGKLSSSSFQVGVQAQEKIVVQVETLDRLVQSGQLEKPDLIKIDVEGAEMSVLQGAEQTLREYQPQLFIEIHSRSLAKDCSDFLQQLNYSITVLETGNLPDFSSEPEVCHFLAKVS
jgi:FkbM family methyltransferase